MWWWSGPPILPSKNLGWNLFPWKRRWSSFSPTPPGTSPKTPTRRRRSLLLRRPSTPGGRRRRRGHGLPLPRPYPPHLDFGPSHHHGREVDHLPEDGRGRRRSRDHPGRPGAQGVRHPGAEHPRVPHPPRTVRRACPLRLRRACRGGADPVRPGSRESPSTRGFAPARGRWFGR